MKKKKKSSAKVSKAKRKESVSIDAKKYPTIKFKDEHEIAMDFAAKAYKKFNKMVKSIILFGSSVKQSAVAGSDIDIVIIIDDAAVQWDQELIAWYREELGNVM